MADDMIKVVLGADVGTSLAEIKKDIKTINGKLVNDETAKIKLTAGLNLNEAKKDIETQMSELSKGLSLNIDNINVKTNSANLINGVSEQVQKDTKKIEQRVKQSVALVNDIGKGYGNFKVKDFAVSDNIIKQAKSYFNQFGENEVVAKFEDDNKTIKSFTTTVTLANGEVQKFKHTLTNLGKEGEPLNLIYKGSLDGIKTPKADFGWNTEKLNNEIDQIQARTKLWLDSSTEETKQYKNEINSLVAGLNNIKTNDTLGLAAKTKQVKASEKELNNIFSTLDSKKVEKINLSAFEKSAKDSIDKSEKLKQDLVEVKKLCENINPKNVGSLDAYTQKFKELKAEVKDVEVVSKIGLKNDNLGFDKITFNNNAKRLNSSIKTWSANNTQAVKKYGDELENLSLKLENIDRLTEGMDSSTKNRFLQNIKAEFRSVTKEAESLNQTGNGLFATFKEKAAKFAGGYGIVGLLTKIKSITVDLVQNVISIDTAMTNLYKVTDNTSKEYNDFLTSACDKAKELGTTVADLVTQTADWAKLGYNLDESSELSRVSAIYQNVGEVDNATAVTDIVTALKAFGVQAYDAMSIIDKYNELGNKFATSSSALGDGLQRSASALSMAGNDINQSLAMITGGTEIIQDSDKMSNALKVLSLRVRGK